MYKMTNKIIAIILILIITLAELSLIGIYGKGVYATSSNLENQTKATTNENVEFEAYFLNEDQETHYSVKKINESNSIYARIRVKNTGYLKDAQIIFKGQDDTKSNFKLQSNTTENSVIQSIDEQNNIIVLNQINNGNTQTIEVPIIFEYSEDLLLSDLAKENKVILTGTYVDAEGVNKKIEKEIKIRLDWTQDPESELTSDIDKFIPYTIGSEEGIIVEQVIKASVKDNVLPVKTTTIEVTVPTINGIKPTEVKVYANSTKATNGDGRGLNFTDANYEYEEENNKIIITVKNEADEEGKIKWTKQSEDEYKVVYKYSKQAKDYMEQIKDTLEDEVKLSLETNLTLNLHNSEQTKLTRRKTQENYYKDQIGEIAQVSIEDITEELSKGYIYANYTENPEKIETEYNQTISAEVTTPEFVDKIVLEQKVDNFTANEGKTKYPTTVDGNNYAYYKTISVDPATMSRILGEDAQIKVYSGESLLGTLDKDLTSIVVTRRDVNELRIETSKPVAEGKLIFDIQKAIKGNLNYTKAQMQSVDKLEIGLDGSIVKEDQTTKLTSDNKTIKFLEPETKADLTISQTNLSTVIKNQDIELRAILRTDEITNNLFKNPQITIQLPKCIEQIEIKNVQLLFDTDLDHEPEVTVVNNQDGSKSIVAKIEGEQIEYSIDSATGGANLVIVADITVNRFTSNRQETIKMLYTNENDNPSQAKETQATINIVAPTGVVTTNTVSNYAEGKESLTSISGEEKTAQIPTLQPSRDVNFNMTVINNYNNTIDDVKVLGRLPFEGNKNLVDQKDLGSTFDMKLKDAIKVSNIDSSRVTIYYSTNPEATEDTTLQSNGWVTTVQDYSTVKSYLIVISGKMSTADSIDFSYTAILPENLQYSEQTVENYIVHFKNDLPTGTIQDKQLATPITITTGTGAVLEAKLSSNYSENQIISVGNYIKYTLEIKNVGTESANNVVINIPIPEYAVYAEYDQETDEYTLFWEKETAQINMPTIEKGQTVTKDIYLQVENINSTDQSFVGEIRTKVIVEADGIQVESNEVTNKVKKPYFKILNNSVENYGDLSEGEEFEFVISVSTTSQDIKCENAILTVPLPEGLTYISSTAKTKDFITLEQADIQVDTKYNNNTIVLNVGNITNSKSIILTIKVKVDNLPKGTYKKVLPTYVTIVADNIKEETSDIKEYTVTKAGLEISQTSNIPNNSTIKAGDELIYIATIKNIGERDVTLTITDKLPANIYFKDMEYTVGDEILTSTTTSNGTVSKQLVLEKGKTLTAKINTKVAVVGENTPISNKVVVTSDEIEGKLESNELKHTIQKTVLPDYTGDEQSPEKANNNINGIVWKDENKNGAYDSGEETIVDVPMLLLNVDTNKLFKQEVTTNADGLYTFTGVPNGNYIVIFQYDSGKYSATKYQAEGIDNTINSDAMDTQITLDGELINVAITDTLSVKDGNVYNISLGLVDNPKFDIRLDKYISKITVQDPTGTKTYNYNNEKLAKVEFVQKYLGQTTAIVEYTISVTNEGAVDGYVKKIVDYLPEQMSFNTELNRDWYINENGAIYNSSLANTKIKPGETKQVTLTLTKRVTASSLGTINNSAEIYEAYNDEGLQDIDSTIANMSSNEDDYSTADIVFSIKTGKELMFIGLTLSIITTIGIGAYFIKKKVLI